MTINKLQPTGTPKNTKVCCCEASQQQTCVLSELSRRIDNLKVCCEKITNIVQDMKQLLTVSKGEKYSESDFKVCYKLMEKMGWLNNLEIKKDDYLSKKYQTRFQINALMNHFIIAYPDLETFQSGPGGRLWVCKKDNIAAVQKIAGKTQTTQHKQLTSGNKYEKWMAHFQDTYPDQTLTSLKIKRELGDLSGSTNHHKIKEYFTELKRRGCFSHVNYDNYKIHGGNHE